MNLISLDIRMLRSLISVVDTGSITETARRFGRTQPAISLQIQRLEDITGKVLFQHEGRRMALTPDGDMVLAYAKSILRLHDELLSRLSSPEVHGHVVLGTPDLYAAYMLPSILSVFKEAFPRIQVELRCALSTPTVDRVQRGEVDVALVTRMKISPAGWSFTKSSWSGLSASTRAPNSRIRSGSRSCRPAISIASTPSITSSALAANGRSLA